MSLLFISHSSKDNAQAIALKNWLVENGWDDLFLDLDPQHGIHAGEKWKKALINASGYCDAFILLISDNWLESGPCLEEYQAAIRLNKKIFPLIIQSEMQNELPTEMTDAWQFINIEQEQNFFTQTVNLPDGSQTDVYFLKQA